MSTMELTHDAAQAELTPLLEQQREWTMPQKGRSPPLVTGGTNGTRAPRRGCNPPGAWNQILEGLQCESNGF